jgi:tetratricopeptide (TPR) repeat protein
LAELEILGRFNDGDALIEDRLKRIPDDHDALFSQAGNAAARGDFAKAHALGQKLIDDGKAMPRDYNEIAWFSLFTGEVKPSDIEVALKATQLSENNTSNLHTLGCIFAEVGKTKEAREVLIQAMDLLNLDSPDENYWYAFGRIAEQYGEREVALAYYSRVSRPKYVSGIHDSAYDLAQVRLQALRSEKQ